MTPTALVLPAHSAFDHLSTPQDYTVAGWTPGSVPQGWPLALQSPTAWTREQFQTNACYTLFLEQYEKNEIDAALRHFQALGLDGHEVGVHNFPLPTLESRLRRLAVELHEGQGFFVLRGLDPKKYSKEDNVLIFLGVSSYIAAKRGRQDDEGRMLSHVRVATLMHCPLDQRPIKDSSLGCAFHNDIFCDIIAMQTHNVAARGGNHIISSTWTIYNELAATRPDLLQVLAAPDWPFDIRGRLCQTEMRPVLYHHGGRIIMSMLPEALLGVEDVPRAPDLPALTVKQMEALEVVQLLAAKHQLVLTAEPGDLTFVNNLSLLHSREAFDDDEQKNGCRYLVRLWLKNEELAWALPKPLEFGNQLVFDDEEVPELWNVAPEPRLSYALRERFSP